MRNIELKVRYEDLAAARRAAQACGARHVWTRKQRDTYFLVPGARCKVREMPGRAEIILYHRPDETRARACEYEIVPVRDGAGARALLGAAWPAGAVVDKTRELWRWRNVRIHLDRVVGLGTFVELEGVVGAEVDDARTQEHVTRVIAGLGLDAHEAVPRSYGDLLASPAGR